MDEVALAGAPELHCHSPKMGFSDREAEGTKVGCGRGRLTTLGKSTYPDRAQSSAKSASSTPVHWYSSAGGRGRLDARPPPPGARPRTSGWAGLPPRRTPYILKCKMRGKDHAENTGNSGKSKSGIRDQACDGRAPPTGRPQPSLLPRPVLAGAAQGHAEKEAPGLTTAERTREPRRAGGARWQHRRARPQAPARPAPLANSPGHRRTPTTSPRSGSAHLRQSPRRPGSFPLPQGSRGKWGPQV